MRYTHHGQDACTTIFSSFTLYLICPKYAVLCVHNFLNYLNFSHSPTPLLPHSPILMNQYYAKVAKGLEAIAAQELKSLGAENICLEFTGVSFTGDKTLLYRVDLLK